MFKIEIVGPVDALPLVVSRPREAELKVRAAAHGVERDVEAAA
jgi:hypothetical protein